MAAGPATHTTASPPRCKGFEEACTAGEQPVPRAPRTRRRWSRSRRLPSPDPGCSANAVQLHRPPPSAAQPHLPPAKGRGHVRRARGTNGRLAPNGRDCLTPVTSQSWRGARSSSAPAPPPAAALSAFPPTRHCAANREAGSTPARTCGRGRVAAPQGRGAEWAGRGRGPALRELHGAEWKKRGAVASLSPPPPQDNRLVSCGARFVFPTRGHEPPRPGSSTRPKL